MRNNFLLTTGLFFLLISGASAQNCEINANANPITITCGQSSVLSVFGSSNGSLVLDEDFNTTGFGAGWGSTPGATNFSNPCSPGGVDGTPHAWMDNNTSVPRTLTSAPYNLSAATAGVTICFDLLFAEQGNAAPCEGPDEPDEGVFLQYSIDGGATWIDIHYFDPNGGNDPQLTNWNNWCFSVPAAAITSNTMFQWHQTADSGTDYDHWGIDNVQIFQNDINAEVVWLHDGYSYGVGSGGGENPTPVSPIATTTYTAQITTGAGDVCTADITVIVIDPVYEVNVTAAPSSICDGDCATISGTAQIVVDPGGIETYENSEVTFLSGIPSGSDIANILLPCTSFSGCNCPDGSTVGFLGTCPAIFEATLDMNINVTTLNGATLPTSSIESVCIDFAQMLSGDFSTYELNLICPDGSSILLANIGDLAGTTLSNVCFDMTASGLISAGSAPYTGSWLPVQPFSNLNGCTANGVYTLQFSATYDYSSGAPAGGIATGVLTGWDITFDDPPIYAPVDVSWSPTTDLTNPSSINTDACPTTTTDYELTLSNGTPGCATYTETVIINVDPCTGCTPPVQLINTLSTCAPGTVDLTAAIGVGSDPATLTYHATQFDAQNDVGPISTTVGTTGSYWVRAEDLIDPTCFEVFEIVVTINPLDDASFTLTDFCAGTVNSATGIVTPGGTFAFNPVPGGGVTINSSTGAISNGVAGSTYTVEYTTNGTCPASTGETVNVTSQDDASFTLSDFCAGTANSATGIVTPGGTFAFNPVPGGGVTINSSTGAISNGVAGSTYTVEYTTVGACSASSTETVNVTSQDDASFTLTDFCAGTANSATNIATPGGTFTFNPDPLDGSTVDSSTGEIASPVAGTTYTIDYTTSGVCPVTSSQTVEAQDCCNIDLDTVYTVSPSCGQADGEINVQAIGGDGSYMYSIDGGPFGSTNSFTGLISGSYDIEVQDGTGTCTDIITVQLTDLNAPTISAINLTQPLCNGDITGEIEVIASGGVGVLTYDLVDGVPVSTNGTGDFTGLGAANYTINVTDENGCIATSIGNIIEPSAVTIDVQYTDVTCFGANDGTIDVLGGGGTPAYNYSIDNGLTWSTNTSYTGLSAQFYQVIVEDDNGCFSLVEDVTIQENGTLTINSIIVDESCENSCDGSITWNVVGGSAPYTYVYNGITAPSNSINSLCGGVYNYTISDNSGCATVGSDTIQPGILLQPVLVSVIPDGCSDICDGQVEITSNTGVLYTLNGISNGTGLFTDLCEGNKLITVTDPQGCSNTITVLVTSTPQTVANFTHIPSSVTIFENTVNFTNESTFADQFVWEISGDKGYYVTYNTTDIEHEFPSDTGKYVICLTAINSNGCQDEYCISIVVEDEIVIFVPNSFTPDGDEFNQTFKAYVNGVDLYDFDFYIFNRWGELIWENHDAEIGWDGTYKGKLVQAGTYNWKIVVKDTEFDYRKTYTGHVNMLK